MYCVTSENNDHLLGFLLSEDFVRQKKNYGSGTTMVGINNGVLSRIKIKNTAKNDQISNCFSRTISELIFLESRVRDLVQSFVSLLTISRKTN